MTELEFQREIIRLGKLLQRFPLPHEQLTVLWNFFKEEPIKKLQTLIDDLEQTVFTDRSMDQTHRGYAHTTTNDSHIACTQPTQPKPPFFGNTD